MCISCHCPSGCTMGVVVGGGGGVVGEWWGGGGGEVHMI